MYLQSSLRYSKVRGLLSLSLAQSILSMPSLSVAMAACLCRRYIFMEVDTSPLYEVNFVDNATATLILHLQNRDIEELIHALKSKIRDGEPSDVNLRCCDLSIRASRVEYYSH